MKTITIAMLFILVAMLSVFPSNEAEAKLVRTDAAGMVYRFEKGDNIWNVCRILCKSVSRDVTKDIAKENGIKNVRRIPKGQEIRIAPRYLNNFSIGQTASVANVALADSNREKQQAAAKIEKLRADLATVTEERDDANNRSKGFLGDLSAMSASLEKVAAERSNDQKVFFKVIGALLVMLLVTILFLIKMALDPSRPKELQESVDSLKKDHEEYVQKLENDRKEQMEKLKNEYAAEVARLKEKHEEELRRKEDRSIEIEFDPDLFKGEFGQYQFGGEEVESEEMLRAKIKESVMALLSGDIHQVKEARAASELMERGELVFK